MRKLLFIINPKSGAGSQAKVPALIDKVISKRDFLVEQRVVEAEGDVFRFGREAVEGGYYGVVAVGGDGTVNGVAAAVADTPVALGVVPCGSGNGLGHHLHVPMLVEGALEVINRDNVESFDYLTVNGRLCMCTCGMGFDAQVAYDFSQVGKRGFQTYLKTTLADYINFKPEDYVIELDDCLLKERAFVIACCNAAQYGNNSFIAPHASMQDGKIDVTIISPFHVLQAPIVGLSLFLKLIDKNHCVQGYRAREIKIRREKEGLMHIDGETVTMPAEVIVKCHPGSIKIFSPGKGENNKS